MNRQPLTPAELDDLLAGLDGWEYIESDGALGTTIRCPSAAAALSLIGAIGSIAEELDHHPDVDWRYDRVTVRSSSHDAGHQVTARDAELARRIAVLIDERDLVTGQ